MFIVLAVLLALSPFVIFELALRAFDIARPQTHADPFVGFSNIHRLFDLDKASGTCHTSHSQLHFFGRQSFPARKPANTFRIFCLGGSTVLGHPFLPPTAFPSWLKIELEGRDPSRPVETINCGGMSYASYRLVPILEEILTYEPDLVVVLTGHNEFLESRTYGHLKTRSPTRAWIEDKVYSLHTITLARKLAAGPRAKDGGATTDGKTNLGARVNARLDHVTGLASYRRDEAWRASVLEHFRFNLHRITELAARAGVPVLLVRPGCNVRDCPPFKSEHRADLTTAREHHWQALFDEGTELESSNVEQALDRYRQAAAIDDQHALLLFRLARCLDRLGKIDEGRTYYERALDQDVCPLRILPEIANTIESVALETEVPLVNAHTLLGGANLPGNEHYVDHVHPGVRGHQKIARAIAEKLVEIEIARVSANWSPEARRAALARHFASLPELYFAQGRARVANLDRWARRDPLLPDSQPADPRGVLARACGQIEFAELEPARAALVRLFRGIGDQKGSISDRTLRIAQEFHESGNAQGAAMLLEVVRDHGSAESCDKAAGLLEDQRIRTPSTTE